MAESSHTATFEALLRPKSVVAVGASSDPHKLSGRPLRYLNEHDFDGEVYIVNPSAAEIQGRPSFATIPEVPRVCDLALVTVGAETLVDAVRQLAVSGVKACLIYSAIPDELRADIDQQLVGIVDEFGIGLIGPNCNGVYNVTDNVAACLSSAVMESPRPTSTDRVALVGQSGGVLSSIYSQGLEHGVRFSQFVATGNELVVTVEDAISYLLEQSDVDVVVAFVEAIRRPHDFRLAMNRARALGKKVVVLTVGRSARAAEIARSHTGAMVGSAAHQQAILDDLGVVVVGDVSDAWGAASLARIRPQSTGGGLAVVTSSGGMAGIAADLASAHLVQLAELQSDTRASIAASIGITELHNPLDLTAAIVGDTSLMRNTLAALSKDLGVSATLVVLSRTGGDVAAAREVVAAIKAGQSVFAVWLSDRFEQSTGYHVFVDGGVPVFDTVRDAMCAFSAVARAAPGYSREPRPLAGTLTAPKESATVDEARVKGWLGKHGVHSPPGELARSTEDAVASANRIGYPVALKVSDPVAPHKAAAGVIRLNCRDEHEVRVAASQLADRAAELGAENPVRLLVERFAPAADGQEWLLGVRNDFALGPILVFGQGGAQAEQLHDVVSIPMPVRPHEAEAFMAGCAAYRRLRGRMTPEARAGLIEAVVQVSALAFQHRADLAELDLNPVVVDPTGRVTTLDGLAVVRRGGALMRPEVTK